MLEEQQYFDHDYLAEFGAFYALSARGYPNICRRLTFFDESISDTGELRQVFEAALGGDMASAQKLQSAFLGFVVVRPIPGAPFGRTVFRLYPKGSTGLERITDPCREYCLHLAGLELKVVGLAWQQQERGVSACATIALWTMLHSSAFNERHALPTTVSVTLAANKTASAGDRVFPSHGLRIEQLLEAIKEHQLSPLVMEGDLHGSQHFTKERFCGTLAAMLRSGYPVLLAGSRGTAGHAVCATGFRPALALPVAAGKTRLDDANFEHIYIHDDNLGASVRFRVAEDAVGAVQLVPTSPTTTGRGPRPVADPCAGIQPLFPTSAVIAVHREIRIGPDVVHDQALERAEYLALVLASPGVATSVGVGASGGVGLTVGVRYLRLSSYLGTELQQVVLSHALARVRLALTEEVVPMSYFIAVARFSLNGSPLMDVLFDTTDTDVTCRPFAHLVLSPIVDALLTAAGLVGPTRTDWMGASVDGL